MRTETFGGLRVSFTGGTDREGGGDGPLVVLLHGFGASGDDLVPFHRVLDVPNDVRFAFPAAPIELTPPSMGESRAWWRIDMAALEEAMMTGRQRDMASSAPVGLSEAREAVSGALDEMVQALKPRALVLGGFSQGAMLSLDVALRGAHALDGLALMSGTFLCESEWRPRMGARSGLRVLMSHGSHDPLLPFSETERLAHALDESGWLIDFVGFRGQHEIPPVVLDHLGALIGSAAGAST